MILGFPSSRICDHKLRSRENIQLFSKGFVLKNDTRIPQVLVIIYQVHLFNKNFIFVANIPQPVGVPTRPKPGLTGAKFRSLKIRSYHNDLQLIRRINFYIGNQPYRSGSWSLRPCSTGRQPKNPILKTSPIIKGNRYLFTGIAAV
ncbi:uncharacterized protein METZ01_LOCUS232647, partial [marine metagenome]